jgi:hypothetical protein
MIITWAIRTEVGQAMGQRVIGIIFTTTIAGPVCLIIMIFFTLERILMHRTIYVV